MPNAVQRALAGLALLAALLFAQPAGATVTITFYSHNFHMFHGVTTEFPHGFALLSGTTGDGQPVKANLGFSATSFYIAALFHPINGALDEMPLPPGYVEEADFHFAFPLSDAQYRAVMAMAEKWRSAPQPSYDYYTRNCVTFIRDIALSAGLSVSYAKKFIHDPKEFLNDVALRNAAFLAPYATPATATATPTVPAGPSFTPAPARAEPPPG